MTDLFDPDVRIIADQIENYLNNHPNAADTSEGIAKWWLPPEMEASGFIIDQALNYLCLKSRVKVNVSFNGSKIFSRKRSSQDESN